MEPSTPIIPDSAGNIASPPSAHHRARSIITTVLIVIAAPLIALCLTAFVFQSYQVEGRSMETTLFNNDRLIVLKVKRTLSRLTHHSFIPPRYSIVVFTSQVVSDHPEASQRQLVKRVMGLPGDHVVIQDNRVTIYNKAHSEGFDPDKDTTTITRKSTLGNVDLTVPAGQVFVLGDNRAVSYDSRFFGPIPVGDIVGTLAMRILPIGSAQRF